MTRRPLLTNLVLLVALGGAAAHASYQAWRAGRFDYVEASFAIQTLVMLFFILVRRPHQALDPTPWHQAVALVAFGSGVFFLGQPPSGGPVAHHASQGITLVANLLGIIVTLNLGRSFGILIALREVRTGGLYSLVRHPMYATDILLRVGYLVSHLGVRTVALFVLSTGAYVWRALLEERFLAQSPEYQAYRERVRWRFLPGIF
jgi:protein-S-isoprenylcysteine O-methyltransferase Ste14